MTGKTNVVPSSGGGSDEQLYSILIQNLTSQAAEVQIGPDLGGPKDIINVGPNSIVNYSEQFTIKGLLEKTVQSKSGFGIGFLSENIIFIMIGA